MADITTIPITELEQDLLASQNDIKVCDFAMLSGVIKYSGGFVQERIDANERIIKGITKELKRRHAIPDYKNMLFNLLAILHRDGGLYTEKHGVVKSVEDAMKIASNKVVR